MFLSETVLEILRFKAVKAVCPNALLGGKINIIMTYFAPMFIFMEKQYISCNPVYPDLKT